MASAVLTAALTRSDRTLWAGMCSRGHRHAAAAARTVPAIFAPGWPEQYCPLVQSCRPPDRPENLTRITWSIGLGNGASGRRDGGIDHVPKRHRHAKLVRTVLPQGTISGGTFP